MNVILLIGALVAVVCGDVSHLNSESSGYYYEYPAIPFPAENYLEQPQYPNYDNAYVVDQYYQPQLQTDTRTNIETNLYDDGYHYKKPSVQFPPPAFPETRFDASLSQASYPRPPPTVNTPVVAQPPASYPSYESPSQASQPQQADYAAYQPQTEPVFTSYESQPQVQQTPQPAVSQTYQPQLQIPQGSLPVFYPTDTPTEQPIFPPYDPQIQQLNTEPTQPPFYDEVSQTQQSFTQDQANGAQTQQSFTESQTNGAQTQQSFTESQTNGAQTQQSFTEAQTNGAQTQQSFTETQTDKSQTEQSFTEAQTDKSQTENSFTEAQTNGAQTQQSFNSPTEAQTNGQTFIQTDSRIDTSLEEDGYHYGEPDVKFDPGFLRDPTIPTQPPSNVIPTFRPDYPGPTQSQTESSFPSDSLVSTQSPLQESSTLSRIDEIFGSPITEAPSNTNDNSPEITNESSSIAPIIDQQSDITTQSPIFNIRASDQVTTTGIESEAHNLGPDGYNYKVPSRQFKF